MLARGIHVTRSIFDVSEEPKLIPDGSPVYFSHLLTEVFQPNPGDTSTFKVNKIEYLSTGKFKIATSSTTQNDFLILWTLNIHSGHGNVPPTFCLKVEDSENNTYAQFSNQSVRNLDTLFGSVFVHLPTPSNETIVYYYFSLINFSGFNCYYASQVFDLASILIMSIDTLEP